MVVFIYIMPVMAGMKLKMYLLVALMFAIVYAVVTVIGKAMGIGTFYFYAGFAFVLIFIQYMAGPKIVELTMKVDYVERDTHRELHEMVEDLARRADIPKPKVCISRVSMPNAFAFGRTINDGRVCVTEGIMNLLSKEELKAVLGHELTHLKNRDVLIITLLSVIPLLMYRLAWHLLFFGSYGRRREGGAYLALLGMAAFLFYFVTNLLVLYASRIREYFADRGSIEMGNRPSAMASALYKLVFGSARTDQERLKEVEGVKAFFLNDPSRARDEIKELAQIDLDRDGTIDPDELRALYTKDIELNFTDKLMEVLSTHPNMLRRVKKLSEYS